MGTTLLVLAALIPLGGRHFSRLRWRQDLHGQREGQQFIALNPVFEPDFLADVHGLSDDKWRHAPVCRHGSRVSLTELSGTAGKRYGCGFVSVDRPFRPRYVVSVARDVPDAVDRCFRVAWVTLLSGSVVAEFLSSKRGADTALECNNAPAVS